MDYCFSAAKPEGANLLGFLGLKFRLIVFHQHIHLAYISAKLDNRISKGDLISGQAVLGVALTTALVCGALGAKLAQVGKRGRTAKIGLVVGFCAALAVLWGVEAAWEDSRSPEEVVKHVIQTRQFWALRDVILATNIVAAAATNGAAASLAASYYHLKGAGDDEHPELTVKAYRYAQLATLQGQGTGWVSLSALTNEASFKYLKPKFEAALQRGKLSEAEQTWAKDHLAQMPAEPAKEEPSAAQP